MGHLDLIVPGTASVLDRHKHTNVCDIELILSYSKKKIPLRASSIFLARMYTTFLQNKVAGGSVRDSFVDFLLAIVSYSLLNKILGK